MQRVTWFAVVALGSIGLIAGCDAGAKVPTFSSAPDVATAAHTSPTPHASASSSTGSTVSTAGVKSYFEALNSTSHPEKMREALKLSAPGSPAYAYLSLQANVAESDRDGGMTPIANPVEDLGDGSFKVCSDPSDQKSCATYANFTFNAANQLVDLTVDNQPLGPRLTLGNGQSVMSAGSTFTFLSAYRTLPSGALWGALWVTVKIQTGSKHISPNLYAAAYASPDGTQRHASRTFGATEVDPNSSTVVTMVFPLSPTTDTGVPPAGRVTLTGCVADCTTQFEAVMKVG